MLQIEDMRKTYDTGDEALRGVSFEVAGNEKVAIIGPSGAGKSTLVQCINRLTEPTGGTVRLDDTELTALGTSDLRAARRDIGMIFQEYNLVDRLTVMENVLSGRLGYLNAWDAFRRNFPPEDVEYAYDTLELVGMEGFENDRADELSGGQRQRVGIARAILQRPKILLADEPTSSLDPETSRIVMELLSDIAQREDIPVLINIHEVPLAEDHADRIIGLTEGEKVFDGPAEDLDQDMKDVIYRGEEIPDETAVEASHPSADAGTAADDDGPSDELLERTDT
jgi:phosphonate transport system ATP-binding protein